MKTRSILAALAILTVGFLGAGCTQEEVDAVLTGVQVVADELDNDDEVTFRDWVSSELDD